ncbi:MAG: response regulator [Candidatus Heimdallarchaeota archaeon]|nr:response regulator [Candidatus Heimdallarchaeota archaeon]
MFYHQKDLVEVDKSVHVLIIDDEERITRIYKKILDQYYTVSVANTIHQSFDRLVSEIFDVIILDYSFDKKIDGIEYSNIIRNTQPTVFILMYTDERDYEMVKRAINFGSIDRFLNKPVNTKELINIVKMVKDSSKVKVDHSVDEILRQSKAKQAIGSVLNPHQDVQYGRVDGIIFSKDSLPLFSKIPSKELFNNFSDTLFTGMISALGSFGDELFDTQTGLRTLTYGNVSLVFERTPQIDVCFILSNVDVLNQEKIVSSLSIVLEKLQRKLEDDKKFLSTLEIEDPFIQTLVYDFEMLLNAK